MPIVNFHITGSADGLQMTLAVRDNSNGNLLLGTKQYKCLLPPLSPQLRDCYRLWKQKYSTWLGGMATLTPSSPPIEIKTNVSVLEECQTIGEELIREFNIWINHAYQIQIALVNIISKDDYCQNPSNFCFILNADTIDPLLNQTLQRLPFHAWDFIQEFYPYAEIALSTTCHALPLPSEPQRLQVLVVLGYDPNIDLAVQQIAIGKQLVDSNLADVTYWDSGSETDAISSLYKTFKTSSPHVLFFIGHSESTNGSIRIWLNETEYISPEDPIFKKNFIGLKSRGLIFSAWISCDGLGIAQELCDLGIPYLMVSREILPVHVAKEFLDDFLAQATKPGVPIHIALSHARQHLQETVESRQTWNGCPNASTFPVIFQIPEQHSYILNPIPLIPNDRTLWQSLFNLIKVATKIYSKRTWKIILGFSLGLISAIVIWHYFFYPPIVISHLDACDATVKDIPYISCGEKIIIDDRDIDPNAKQGMQELGLATPNFERAIEDLEIAWNKNQKNSEVLIALSNAKIKLGQQKSIEQNILPPIVKTIAVVVPAPPNINERYLPLNLLAAVAEAQRAWNDTRHDWLLQVVVANDENDPKKQHIVKELLNRPILGTIGHYSSYVTEGVLPLYKRNKLTLISGTSTATNLGRGHPFFFRTVSATNAQTDNIVNFLIKKNISKVEFLHGKRTFATSFKDDLMNKAKRYNIHVNSSYLTSKILNPRNVLDTLKLNKSQVLILCPDAFIDPEDRDNMHLLITLNAGKIPIIGNEVVYEPWLLAQIEKQPELGRKLTFSFTWSEFVDQAHFSRSAYSKIPIWWKDKNDLISHQTILNYDAATVLIQAVDRAIVKEKIPNNQIRFELPKLIRKVTTNKGIEGITGKITFKGSDRAENLNGLVQPIFNDKGELKGFKAPQ
jgi:branched-chain amino acid transport system substrate-binding protein